MNRTQSWTLALTAVVSLMVALDLLVVTTALPTLHEHLHASLAQLEWTVNGYTLSFAVLLMSGSAIGERFGRRLTLASGLVLFAASSAACALAPSIGWLISARVVQGIGAALVMPTALSLLGVAFPAERRAWALGIFGAITGIAVLGGPVIGGAIAQGIAWQWIFWVNVPIGLAAVPLVLIKLEESRGVRRAPDFVGAGLVTVAALGVVWGLVRSGSAGWGSLEVIATLAGGILVAVAFVRWELRANEPLLPMGMFASRAFSAGNGAVFCLFAGLAGAVFFMAQFLQVSLADSPLQAGVRMLPWTATVFFVAPMAGRQVSRTGERPLAAAGLTMQAIGMGWIALVAGAHVAYGELVAPLVIAGTGASMAIPAIQNAVLGAVAPSEIGQASGAFNTTRQLGGAFGVAVMAAAFAATGSYVGPQAFSDGFSAAMAVSAALSLAGAAAALSLPGRRQVPQPSLGEHAVAAEPSIRRGAVPAASKG